MIENHGVFYALIVAVANVPLVGSVFTDRLIMMIADRGKTRDACPQF